MFCPKCGREQVDNPKFCRNCGEGLNAQYTAPMEATPPYYDHQTEGGMKWSIGNVVSFLIRAAILTAILYGVLFFTGGAIASSVLPDEIHYVSDGWCDVCHEPAQYYCETINGQASGEFCGEFCFGHAVLYAMADSVRHEGGAFLESAPFEIEFLRKWSFLIIAVIISIPLSWWWETRKGKQKQEG